jgi:hypothetical protein
VQASLLILYPTPTCDCGAPAAQTTEKWCLTLNMVIVTLTTRTRYSVPAPRTAGAEVVLSIFQNSFTPALPLATQDRLYRTVNANVQCIPVSILKALFFGYLYIYHTVVHTRVVTSTPAPSANSVRACNQWCELLDCVTARG